MDLATFEDQLDRHGADLAAWPEALRGAAAALLDRSQEARAARRDLGEIEDLLRADRPVMDEAGAFASRAMRHRQDRLGRRVARRTGWAVAAVVALMLGLFVGGIGPERGDGPDHVMATALEQMAPLDVD